MFNMETHVQDPEDKGPFKRSEKFEINDIEFRDIEVTEDRVKARGKKWNAFELLLAFVGAAWMERWRRFSLKVLVAGVVFFFSPISLYVLSPMFWGGTGGLQIMLLFMIIGLILIAVWAFVKREALLLFTPGGMFKIEGTAGFVDALWNEIGPKVG
jgi:hypothetical protein